MEAVQQIKKWHEIKLGLAVFFLIELAASYGFVSWAIYNGNLICYIAAIVLFIGAIKNLVKLIGSFIHGKH